MLGVDYFDNKVNKLRNNLMNTSLFPQTSVVAAAYTPCDFLLPYVQSSLEESAKLAQEHGHIRPVLEENRKPSSFEWEWDQSTYRHLLQSKNSIKRHFQRHYGNSQLTSPRLRALMVDYDSLIQETRENAGQLQSMLQNDTSRQAIKETQKSLDQADAVRRYDLRPCYALLPCNINLESGSPLWV